MVKCSNRWIGHGTSPKAQIVRDWLIDKDFHFFSFHILLSVTAGAMQNGQIKVWTVTRFISTMVDVIMKGYKLML